MSNHKFSLHFLLSVIFSANLLKVSVLISNSVALALHVLLFLFYFQVTQNIHVVDDRDKMKVLYRLLDEALKVGKVIIFSATKKDCDSLCRTLNQDHYRCNAIHGDKTQYDSLCFCILVQK